MRGLSPGPSRTHAEQAVTVTGLAGGVLLSCGQILKQKACLPHVSLWFIWREIHTRMTYTLCINLSVSLSCKPHIASLPAYLSLQDDSNSLPSSSLPEGQETGMVPTSHESV